jgi:hypothetical protein
VNVLVAVLTLALLAVVILFVSAPLRGARVESPESPGDHRPPRSQSSADRELVADLAELRAAREAKHREIRDAELDYRTGKLSREDYAAVDGTLRAEAVAILDRLAALEALEGEGQTDVEDAGEPGL